MNIILIFLLSFTILFPKSSSSQNRDYDACLNRKLNCGGLVNISYPFYDGLTRPAYCGHPGFKLDCVEGVPRINVSAGHEYYVKSIDAYNNIKVYRKDKWTGYCPDSLTNTTIDFSRFKFLPSNENITFFYDCDGQIPGDVSFTTACNLGGYTPEAGYYLTQEMVDQHKDLFHICKSNLFLPILQAEVELDNLKDVIRAFHSGFELGFMAENDACAGCVQSGGECGYKWGSKYFVCHCADADYDIKCGVNSTSNKGSQQKSDSQVFGGLSDKVWWAHYNMGVTRPSVYISTL